MLKPRQLITLDHHNHDTSRIRAARRDAAQTCPVLSPPLALRHHTFGGALYEPMGSEKGFVARDKVWLSQTPKGLGLWGIPIAKDYTITPVNLVYGHDIFNPPAELPSTDTLIIGHMVNPSRPEGQWHIDKCGNDQGTLVSWRDKPENWQTLPAKLGAKAVVVYSYDVSEVRGADLVTDSYILLPPRTVIAPRFCMGGHFVDYTQEILVRRDYAEALVTASRNPQHPMAVHLKSGLG